MPRSVYPKGPSPSAPGNEQTLYELGTRDLWQMPVVARDRRPLGHVIRQIIQPEMYTIRYLVIYDPERRRHFLIPSSIILEIEGDYIRCDITAEQASELPAFAAPLERDLEFCIYATLGRTPYWVEESSVLYDRTDLL